MFIKRVVCSEESMTLSHETWPYVSLNEKEFKLCSICFYITVLSSRFWAQLLLTSQEIAPEIGLMVWVAYKPPLRYETKWERQGGALHFSISTTDMFLIHLYGISCLCAASGHQRSESVWIQNGSWCQFSLAACRNTSQILSHFLSVMHPLVFSSFAIAVNGLGSWYVLPPLWERMEELEFHWSGQKYNTI